MSSSTSTVTADEWNALFWATPPYQVQGQLKTRLRYIPDKDVFIKSDEYTVNEAAAIRMLEGKLSVRIPRIIAQVPRYPLNGHVPISDTLLVMERIPGSVLSDVLANFNDEQLRQTTQDLCRVMKELHQCDAQSQTFRPVAGVDQIPFAGTELLWSEKPDLQTWEEWLYVAAQGGPKRATETTKFRLEYYLAKAETQPFSYDLPLAQPMFTPGDLVPENIIVDESTGKIVGLVDLAMSGWYPYFWNKTRALIMRGHLEKFAWEPKWKRIVEEVWPGHEGQAIRQRLLEDWVSHEYGW